MAERLKNRSTHKGGALGFLYLAGSVPLAAGLSFADVLNVDRALNFLLGLVAVLFELCVGELLRAGSQQQVLRQSVLWAFLAMGSSLIVVGVLPVFNDQERARLKLLRLFFENENLIITFM